MKSCATVAINAHPEMSWTVKLYFKIKTKHSIKTFHYCDDIHPLSQVCEKKKNATKHFRLNIMLRLVELVCLHMKTNSPFMIWHHQKVEFIMPKPKQMRVKRNTETFDLCRKKSIRSFIGYVIKKSVVVFSDDLSVCCLRCSGAPGPWAGHRWDQPR